MCSCWAGCCPSLSTVADAVFTPAFALLIWVGASDDLTDRASWLGRRWLVFAGEVSFCFYLVHETVLIVLYEHLGLGNGLVSGAVFTILVLLIVSAAAVALHRVVELPVQRRLISRPVASAAPVLPQETVELPPGSAA